MTPPRRAKTNSRNRQQIAKALRDATGCTYQQALHRVEDAAARDLLPPVLDKAGRGEAVRLLSAALGSSGPARVAARDETAPRRTSVVPNVPGGSDKTMVRTEWWRPDFRAAVISGSLTGLHRRMAGVQIPMEGALAAPVESARVRVLDLDSQPSLPGPWRDGPGYVPVILDVPPPGAYDPGLGLSPAERDEILRQLGPEA